MTLRGHRWRGTLIRWGPSLLIGLVLVLIPLILGRYERGLLTQILIYAVFAMSMNLLMGYTGLISFGHAAPWGIGAFTVGVLATRGITDSFWLIMLAAIVVTALICAVFGFLSLRTTGVYFVLVTLALAQLLYSLAVKWREFSGGEEGLSGIRRPWSLGDGPFYYLIFVGFVIFCLVVWWLVQSRFGRVLVGIRENEGRMRALGFNTWAYKYTCFIVASILAAMAGALFCFYNGHVGAGELGFGPTCLALLMVLIGGAGTLFGPVIGAAIVVLLINFLSAYTQHWGLLLGVIFVLSVMFMRGGVVGYFSRYWSRMR